MLLWIFKILICENISEKKSTDGCQSHTVGYEDNDICSSKSNNKGFLLKDNVDIDDLEDFEDTRIIQRKCTEYQSRR